MSIITDHCPFVVCSLGIAGFYRGVDANVMRAMVRVNYRWMDILISLSVYENNGNG